MSSSTFPRSSRAGEVAAAALKGLAWFHRWVGILMCLLFATWFATGAVMVFVAFPSLSDADRAAASQVIDLGRVRLTPAQAAARMGEPGDLRLLSRDGAPVYAGTGVSGKAQAISAETGEAEPLLSPTAARRIAAAFGRAPAAQVSGPFDYDQWVVHQQFDAQRPVYRVRLADRAHSDIYVSARTGEVLLRTRRVERGWNWVGSVVHWVYFVPIRKSFALWDWLVWVVALVGLSTAAAGVWLGVQRSSKKLRSRKPALSPFRGLLRWHHIIGLAAGAFVIFWITSGWLSMDHGRLFSEGQSTAAAAQAYKVGTRPPGRELSLADLRQLTPASVISFQQVAGRSLAAARGPAGDHVLGAGEPVGAALPRPVLLDAVHAAWPGDRVESVAPVRPDSAYAKAEGLPSTALQLRLAGAQPMRLFVDGLSGRVLVTMDPSREAYAWVYYMLHTYNFPGLAEHPAVRIPILLTPLALGFVFSITGVLVGVRRLRSFQPAPKPKRKAMP
jgi:uncharacterized iron-regulated membrane protein